MLNKLLFVMLSFTSLMTYAQIPAGGDVQNNQSVDIQPINLCPNTLTGTLTTSPPPGQSYCITSDLYIYTPILFSNSEFKISPNVKIIVGNGGSLSIDKSHLYSCNNMWQGIIVYDPTSNAASNGKVFIQNNCLIEDANAAISFPYGNTNVFSNFFVCTEAVFNKNDTAIILKNYSPSGSLVPTPYYFGINRTIITCRKIPYNQIPPFVPSAAYYSNLKATANNPGVPYVSPYINNSVYPFTVTKLGKNAQIGIYLEKVGVSVSPTLFYDIEIGFTAGFSDLPYINIFDNLEYGIYAYSSNFTCINNVFQNGNINNSAQVGRGIYAEALQTDNNRIRVKCKFLMLGISYWGVGCNKFFDLSRAIETKNYLFHDIINCDIRSSQINTLPTLPTPYHKGEFGILVKTNRYHKSIIEYNTIFNVENGIVYFTTFGTINIPTVTPGAVANAQYSGQIDIDSNIVQPNFFYTPITTQYISNAIYLANTVPFGSIYQNSSLKISVSGNTLKNVYRGIYIANFQNNKTVTSSRNCISLFNQPSSIPNPIQYGILREFMYGPISMNNFVTENNIQGTGISNTNMSGIYIRGSVFENVRCNNVSNVYSGIVFDKCPQACNFIGNGMYNYVQGFTLKNASVIGAQGNVGSPSDNSWGPANCVTTFKTYVDNANAIFSPLYVRMNPSNLNPQGCGNGIGGPYYDNTLYPGTLIYTTGPLNLPCPINHLFPTCAPIIPNPNLINPPSPSSNIPPLFTSTNTAVPLMEKIVQNQIPMSIIEQWTKKNSVYRSLTFEPSIQYNSSPLNNFYNYNSSSSYQQFLDIESDIFSGNLLSAQTRINLFSSQNNIETNFKTYYQIYLNYANTGKINSNDSIILYTLASSCSLLNGDAVFLARALYNAAYDKIVIWDDNCTPSSSGQKLLNSNTSDNNTNYSNNTDDFKIFPNPANNDVFISSHSGRSISFIKITDITGKEVFFIQPNTNVYPYRLKLDLRTGIYLICIITEDEQIFIQKLIINK